MARILIVEDDASVSALLQRFLESHGHTVDVAVDGGEGLVRAPQADLVLLDVGLPVLDGMDVANSLRRGYPHLPVIMVTARDEQEARLDGFGAGADDYVTKPFDLRELHARIVALLRRSGYSDTVERGALRLELDARKAYLDGEPLGLTRLEFDILALLARNPDVVFSRERLLEQVWGPDFLGEERTVDVRIAGLRRKLGDSAGEPRFIEGVRGIGYRFVRGS